MERLPASPRMAPRKESFGRWTGEPGFCSPTTLVILQRNFTTRTKQPQTGITSRRLEDISSRRWLRTAESTSAPRRPWPSLACCLSDSTRSVREIRGARHSCQTQEKRQPDRGPFLAHLFSYALGLSPF